MSTVLDEVERFKLSLDDLTVLATAHLAGILSAVDLRDIRRSMPLLRAEVADVVDAYSLAAAAIAVDYYRALRFESPATGRFVPTPHLFATADDIGRVVGYGVKPLFTAPQPLAGGYVPAITPNPAPLLQQAERRMSGGVQRLVTNSARATVIENTAQDPVRARYWRHAQPDCCAFCLMLATRPPMYKTAQAAGFDAHDWCGCEPVVLWPGQPIVQPDYYGDFHTAYDDASGAARAAGEPVVAPSGRNRRDTVLWRIRQATGRN